MKRSLRMGRGLVALSLVLCGLGVPVAGAASARGPADVCFTGAQDMPGGDCGQVDVSVGFSTKPDAISVIMTNDSDVPWIGGPLGLTLVVPQAEVTLTKDTGTIPGAGYTSSWRVRNGVVDLRCEFTRGAWPNPASGQSVSCDLPRLGLAAGEYPAAFLGFREMIPTIGHGGLDAPLNDPLVVVRGTSRSINLVVSGSVEPSPTSTTVQGSTSTGANSGPSGPSGPSGVSGGSGSTGVASATTVRIAVTAPPSSIDRAPTTKAGGSTTQPAAPTITPDQAKQRGVQSGLRSDGSGGGTPWVPILVGIAIAGAAAAALAAWFAKRSRTEPEASESAEE